MKIEHFAINVKEPREMAAWYVEHLGLHTIRADQEAPYITFLADDENETILEIYANQAGEFLDYTNMSVFTFHIAFAVEDIQAVCNRLITAGASPKGEIITLANGDLAGFVTCPWGITLQFLQRINPLF
jgi:catechol 2,3-dioxygenase-like lactoylglutathione lyase family enzyme